MPYVIQREIAAVPVTMLANMIQREIAAVPVTILANMIQCEIAAVPVTMLANVTSNTNDCVQECINVERRHLPEIILRD